ncbi:MULTISPECIES: TetR family transcriptional regulator [unclassified Paenibacillus]|uniref:TetR family transcriptional regulator n=1 Tax=unclassified Paenibacillus TaxID=185978 RepID=UPI0036CE2413
MAQSKSSSFLSKTEILDAAEQTLRRFGPDKTSVTDVAKLLGVSHGTLYRHYPSKVALREAVTERWLEEQILAPLAEIAQKTTEDPLAQLRIYILKLIELKRRCASEDPEMFKMYAEVTVNSAALIEAHVQRIYEQMSSVVERGVQEGILAESAPPEVLSRSIVQATAGYHHPSHAYEWQRPGIDQEFEQLWALLEKGLKQ